MAFTIQLLLIAVIFAVGLVAILMVRTRASIKGRVAIAVAVATFTAACVLGLMETRAHLDACGKATFESQSGCQ